MTVKYEAADWYATPALYDVVFQQLTDGELSFVEEMYRRYAPARARKRLLEPACGSGRLVEALATKGYRLTGFDLSPEMLAFTRARLERVNLRAVLRRASMQDFTFSRPFDLAYGFVSTFKYLLTEKDAVGHLKCVAAALKSEAVYLLGFHLTEYDGRPDHERWVGRQDVPVSVAGDAGTAGALEAGPLEVVCNIRSQAADPKTRLEHIRCRLKVTQGGETRYLEKHWDFRTYSAAQFRRTLRAVPELELVEVYDFDFDPDRPRKLGHDRLDTVAVLRRR